MQKTCAVCSNTFDHVQTGRGRPPTKCPECRAKAPVVASTLGQEQTRVCASCGENFIHVQSGRGRPPTKCEACRIGKTKPAKVKVEKPPKVSREKRTVRRTPGEILPGDTVIAPQVGVYASEERAIRNAVPHKVISIEGEMLTINLDGQPHAFPSERFLLVEA